MSIILKGIDLPSDGTITILGVYGDGCVSVEKVSSMCLAIEPSIQAIQIPTPHGDLIDRDIVRDECYKTMEELIQSTTINISAEALSLLCGFTIINNTPTILEAEE